MVWLAAETKAASPVRVNLVEYDRFNPIVVKCPVDKALASSVVDVAEVVREVDLKDVPALTVPLVMVYELAL